MGPGWANRLEDVGNWLRGPATERNQTKFLLTTGIQYRVAFLSVHIGNMEYTIEGLRWT